MEIKLMDLAVVILAAGQGTRMQSETPKVLHKIAGMPMLGHVLNLADDLGANPPIVIIGHKAAEVKKYVKNQKINASCIKQEKQLGTANALQCVQKLFESYNGNLLVLYGDVPFIKTSTINAMLNQIRLGSDLAVLGFETNEPSSYGRLIVGQNRNVSKIVEEKDATPSQLNIKICNAGIYCGSAQLIFTLLSGVKNKNAKKEFYLTDIFHAATKKGFRTSLSLAAEDETKGINSKKDLAEAEAYFQNQLRQKVLGKGATLVDPKTIYFAYDTKVAADTVIHPNVVFGPAVELEKNVEILPFSHLEGCTIASGSRIGPFARIRPETRIEQNVKVGNFVEIKKAILKKGSKTNHLSYIGDAEIGSNTNIGAGTIFCNYDGVFKHTTQIGENAFIGSNSSLIAPLKIGSNSLVGSGSVITTDVPSDSLAISRTIQKNKKGLGKRIMEKFKKFKK